MTSPARPALTLLLLAAPLGAQELVALDLFPPAPFVPDGHTFGRSAAGWFDGDGVLDAAVLANGELFLLSNVGCWDAVRAVDTHGDVRDFVPFPGGDASGDAVLAATTGGLELLRWDGSGAFVSESVQDPVAPWTEASLVALAPIGAHDLAAFAVWDAPARRLHPGVLVSAWGGGAPTPVAFLPPVAFERDVHALEMLELDGTLLPEIAIAHEAGLTVLDLMGGTVAAIAEASARGWLAVIPLEGATVDRLAWCHRPTGAPDPRVRTLDGLGASAAQTLIGAQVAALAVADFDGDGNGDLCVGSETPGRFDVLYSSCLWSLDCTTEFDGAFGISATTTAAWPACGRFQPEHDVGVLLFDDLDRTASFLQAADDGGSRLAPDPDSDYGIQFPFDSGSESKSSLIELQLVIDQITDEPITHLQILVWPWPQWDGTLEPELVAAESFVLDEGASTLTATVDFTDAPDTDFFGFQLIGYRWTAEMPRPRAVAMREYAYTSDCDLYEAHLEPIEPDGYPGEPPPCDGNASGGVYLGGMMPIPRLPDFPPGQVPPLPPLLP